MYTGREYAVSEARKCPWGVNRGLKLYYNRARYYNPQLGRFISRDPIDIADDVNLYAYVGNNSVMFVDLMGTEKSSIVVKNKQNLLDDILVTI
jgi:RHS repeat-associated protein